MDETHTVILRIDAPRDGIDVAVDRGRGFVAGAALALGLALLFPDAALALLARLRSTVHLVVGGG